MGPIVIDDAGSQRMVFAASWCTPARVWVRAQRIAQIGVHTGIVEAYNSDGYTLHCRWLAPRVDKQGIEAKAAAQGRVEVWSDCGACFLRAGGELYLAGGLGAWQVEVWSAEEAWSAWGEPQEFWLTTFYEKEREVKFPPFATRFRLLSGEMTVGDYLLAPNVIYPVHIAPESEIRARGFWQAGTVL